MSLKKEMILAIILGALLGASLALLITRFPQKLVSQKEIKEEKEPVLPTAVVSQTPTLEILLPEDQALIQEANLLVSGKTVPEATVAITTPFDEEVIIASADGTFSSEISLEEGANEITIVSIYNGEEMEKSIVVNYTKEEI